METNVPRPEYPRPQFRRRDWLCLNGEWEFAFDDERKGLELGWHRGADLPMRITVPFPYQSELSGIDDKSIHEVVWYARDFEVPETWRSGDLLLHFGAVDYACGVWVNGEEIGHNRGGHVPFWFDIAPYLRPGVNRLALRVEDKQDATQPRGKQSSTGHPFGIDYYCTTGIWQPVWLEPVPSVRIDDVRITPLPDVGAFEVIVVMHAPATGWTLTGEAFLNGETVAKSEVETARATCRLMLRLKEPRLWSPDNPVLYEMRIGLHCDGELLDEIETYGGLRSVGIKDGKLYLNDEPLYLVMVLDQGYWPESYLAAPSDEAMRADVEWAKRFGFNGARKHQKIEDPRWLYWCDKLGLLVWGEMPNAREWSSEAEEALTAEWTRALWRDYNHPSIIAWVPVNESMGFPGLLKGHPGQLAFIERIVTTTRRHDTTRPVIDNDGWEHSDVTDIYALHDYSHTGEDLVNFYRETLKGGPLPETIWTGTRAITAKGSSYRGQPVMLTEVGGLLSVPDLPPERRDGLYEVYGFVNSNEELMRRYVDLMQGRSQPKPLVVVLEELMRRYVDLMQGLAKLWFVAGFCYTQLTDIEQELNGLLTYDRRPKVDPEAIARLHKELFEGFFTRQPSGEAR